MVNGFMFEIWGSLERRGWAPPPPATPPPQNKKKKKKKYKKNKNQ